MLVARALRDRIPEDVELVEHEGEPTALIDAWSGRRVTVVVDAIAGKGPPGAVRSFDATFSALPASLSGGSTHAFTLPQAIELARALGRLPVRLLVVGIEGARFEASSRPARPVADAIEPAAQAVLELLRTYY